jgi:hypothetical protein
MPEIHALDATALENHDLGLAAGIFPGRLGGIRRQRLRLGRGRLAVDRSGVAIAILIALSAQTAAKPIVARRPSSASAAVG